MINSIEVSSHSIKKANTEHEVHPLLESRWSARSFTEKTISKEDISRLLEAASWSPSSMNEQPWRYLIAFKGSPAFQQMTECLSAGNQPWAQNAPILLLSLAETHHANGHPNAYSWYDVGAANQSLLLQAASMGILGHLMGGFNANQAIDSFAIPSSQKPVVFIALGYPDEPEKLPEPFLTRELTPRTRKKIAEIFQYLD